MPRLNIYFCGSMRAGRQDVDLYGILVDKLQQGNMAILLFVSLLYVNKIWKPNKNIRSSVTDPDPSDPFLCFWASWIRIRLSEVRIVNRILLSLSKASKKNLLFCDFFLTFYL
jgi:hypothetical protein